MATLLLWVLVLVFVGAFAVQVRTRVRLIAGAPNTFSTDPLDVRLRRFLVDVVGQRKTIRERPIPGLAHAFVFWGFIAFGLSPSPSSSAASASSISPTPRGSARIASS